MRAARFLFAVAAAALLVPCLQTAIHMAMIAAGNGHIVGLFGAALLGGATAVPLAIAAVPFNAIGTTFVAAFSLGLERLLPRRSVIPWLLHGLAVGGLNLLWFRFHDPSATLLTASLGSWAIASVALWRMLSTQTANDDAWGTGGCRYSSSSS
jgi:hypothetical protein